MLISLQFPLADSRAFINHDVGILSRPMWPALVPDYEFVRSFGSIRKRKLGGLTGWVGEHAICEATRALRFRGIPNPLFVNEQFSALSVPFRRFYFDGLAVGKFDVGLATALVRAAVPRDAMKQFIYTILDLTVAIPSYPNGFVESKFLLAGKHLANLYLKATTKRSYLERSLVESWWVRPGPSLLFVVVPPEEEIKMPFRGILIPIDQSLGFSMSHCVIPYHGKYLPMWVLNLKTESNLASARALRICLLRLHAEHECLKLILQNTLSNKFGLQPRTEASNTLQWYLNEAIRRISRLGQESDRLESDFAEFARISEDTINPGQRDAILESLRNIDIRRNIFKKVQEYVNQTINVQEQIMGDNYTIGQAGAVGPNATARDFKQIWRVTRDEIDLRLLAHDLKQLRLELLAEAKSPDDYTAIGHLSSAEKAAAENDGPKALEYLAKTGSWVLDAATKIGTAVAANAINSSMGIK